MLSLSTFFFSLHFVVYSPLGTNTAVSLRQYLNNAVPHESTLSNEIIMRVIRKVMLSVIESKNCSENLHPP